MKNLFNLLTISIILALVILLFLFYAGVFNPLRKELEKTETENFRSTVSIAEINIENFLNRCIEGTESLSSRTMIKNKLNLYRINQISLQEIRDYTGSKYIDGAEVLHNMIKAVRISNNEAIADFNSENIDIINLTKYQSDSLETSVEIVMEKEIIIVNSPIKYNEINIGQDIAAFNMGGLINDLNKQNFNLSIILEKDVNNGFKDNQNEIIDYRKILDTDYFIKASIKRDSLNQDLKVILQKIIIGMIFIIIILVVFFRIIINKTYNEVIEKLNDKVHKITELSETDVMLGINNRTKFMNELENEIERSHRYNNNISLIMFDIDNFKYINDNYGHYLGDDILINIAKLVDKIVRETDIFARYGGDEFIILLPQTNIVEALELAERLRKVIMSNQIKKDISITCSFGVAEYNNNEDIDDFLKEVDDALYKAKKLGRNRVEMI